MMPTLADFILNAMYVTFCTACIGFGALFFRKMVDDLELKQVQMGEELYLLFDPKAFVGIGIFVFFFCIFVFILSMKEDLTHEGTNMSAPGLVLLVVPMVLVVNMIQLYFRAKWQRLSVRTSGILIRRMLSEKMIQLRFSSQPMLVRVEREFLWFRLRFEDDEGSVLGQCALSAPGLKKILSTIHRVPNWHIHSADILLDDENQQSDGNDSLKID